MLRGAAWSARAGALRQQASAHLLCGIKLCHLMRLHCGTVCGNTLHAASAKQRGRKESVCERGSYNGRTKDEDARLHGVRLSCVVETAAALWTVRCRTNSGARSLAQRHCRRWRLAATLYCGTHHHMAAAGIEARREVRAPLSRSRHRHALRAATRSE